MSDGCAVARFAPSFAHVGILCASIALVATSGAAQNVRTRDSSGVRIVENPSRLKAPVVFTLGTKLNADIGGLDDDPDKELVAANP
ncbi:MAG: hypothetical protein ACO1Q7_19875 [Gemmatimonas sp.]